MTREIRANERRRC